MVLNILIASQVLSIGSEQSQCFSQISQVELSLKTMFLEPEMSIGHISEKKIYLHIHFFSLKIIFRMGLNCEMHKKLISLKSFFDLNKKISGIGTRI